MCCFKNQNCHVSATFIRRSCKKNNMIVSVKRCLYSIGVLLGVLKLSLYKTLYSCGAWNLTKKGKIKTFQAQRLRSIFGPEKDLYMKKTKKNFSESRTNPII